MTKTYGNTVAVCDRLPFRLELQMKKDDGLSDRIAGFITKSPFLFGIFLAVVWAALITIRQSLFAHHNTAPADHARFLYPVLFTVAIFALWISAFWRWRRIGAFWASVSILFALHMLGVWLYSTLVHPLALLQWSILLFLETYVAFSFINWFTRKLGHPEQ